MIDFTVFFCAHTHAHTNTHTHKHTQTHANMPFTESITVPCDARGRLIAARQGICDRLRVKMFFPRNKVRGRFQEMILEGGVGAIREAKKETNWIVAEWQRKFDAWQAHKREQKQFDDRSRHLWKAQELERSVTPTMMGRQQQGRIRKAVNGFAGLEVDRDTQVIQHYPSLRSSDRQVDGTKVMEKNKLGNTWATMAAKPAAPIKQKPKQEPKQKPRPEPLKLEESFNWGDESDEEFAFNSPDYNPTLSPL